METTNIIAVLYQPIWCCSTPNTLRPDKKWRSLHVSNVTKVVMSFSRMTCVRSCWLVSNFACLKFHSKKNWQFIPRSTFLSGRSVQHISSKLPRTNTHTHTQHDVRSEHINDVTWQSCMAWLRNTTTSESHHYNILSLGICESFFLRSNQILNRIGRPIRFRIEFSNRIGRIYTSEYLIHSIGIYFVFVTNESDARNWVLVIHFNSFQFSPKTRQTMPLYDYLTPKLDFKCKFNHRQSFLYKGRLTMRTIRKFRIGSSLRIESRI